MSAATISLPLFMTTVLVFVFAFPSVHQYCDDSCHLLQCTSVWGPVLASTIDLLQLTFIHTNAEQFLKHLRWLLDNPFI